MFALIIVGVMMKGTLQHHFQGVALASSSKCHELEASKAFDEAKLTAHWKFIDASESIKIIASELS